LNSRFDLLKVPAFVRSVVMKLRLRLRQFFDKQHELHGECFP
jgi:hypothetical protein